MRRSRKRMAEMNVVPYIDVMLVLLVIFMVTAPMMQAGVAIELPKAEANPINSDNQQEPLIIFVDQSGQYFIRDDEPVTEADLSAYVGQQLAQQPQRAVYIRADASVVYQSLMSAMVAVQQAGAKTINLMAEPLPRERN